MDREVSRWKQGCLHGSVGARRLGSCTEYGVQSMEAREGCGLDRVAAASPAAVQGSREAAALLGTPPCPVSATRD